MKRRPRQPTGAFSVGESNLGGPPSITPMKFSSTRIRISTPITMTIVRATLRNGSKIGSVSIR